MPIAATRIAAPKKARPRPFKDAGEHLLAELERLILLLHAEIQRMRAMNLLNENQFRGLYVSDEQINAILDTPTPADQLSAAGDATSGLSEFRIIALQAMECEQRIAARCRASARAGLALPLQQLAELYSLSKPERDALLLILAPELDSQFEVLYSYAQNDVTRKRPTAGLILRLLGADAAQRLRLRNLFSPTGTLLRTPLVSFLEDAQERDRPLLSRALRVEERIVDFVLQQEVVDSRLTPFTRRIKPTQPLASFDYPKTLAEGLLQAAAAVGGEGAVFFFHGPEGAGKHTAAAALSAEAGRGLVVADAAKAQAAGASIGSTLTLLRREAQLHHANLLLAHADAWLAEEGTQRMRPEHLCELFSEPVGDPGFLLFVTSQSSWPVAEESMRCAWMAFEFPVPGFLSRTQIWQKAIETVGGGAQPETAATLANQFVLTGGKIYGACRMAATHALLRGQDPSTLSLTDLEAAARAQSNQGLMRRAQKVDAFHAWSDLVLPPRTIQHLREVCAAEKYRGVIYSAWGFDRRLVSGKGLNVLFSGPSGTGKTMSAGIIARDLGLDLYKIDLSSVISKYIGETEKQLSQIFHEAQSSNAILFFDEADAIFGKRSEVKDAHDRYANVEVAYLLQKMEEYEGIVILATNFRKNIDEAFTRRIQYIVEFPFPEAAYRERIWRSLIPAGAPLGDDVDFGFLGRQFELAGGNIRNVVLVAAFLAAQEGGTIRMKHFVQATARELQKTGKMPSRSEFREHYETTRERVDAT